MNRGCIKAMTLRKGFDLGGNGPLRRLQRTSHLFFRHDTKFLYQCQIFWLCEGFDVYNDDRYGAQIKKNQHMLWTKSSQIR